MALKAGYERKEKVETLITQVKKEYEEKLNAATLQVELKNTNYIDGLLKKLQFASDKLYGADFAFQLDDNKDRTDLVVNNRINEARKVLPSPSIEQMLEENIRVKDELDETKTSLEQLRKNHEEVISQAGSLNKQVDEKKRALEAAKKERQDLEKEKNSKIASLQDDLNKANNDIIAKEKARSDDFEAIKEAKTKASAVLGGLALLALAGAIWSPIQKDKFAVFSAILGFIAIAIWFIQPWMVGLIAGLAILAILAIILKKYNEEKKAATATYKALSSVKEKDPEVWKDTVSPELTEYHQKYKTENGKIVKVKDESITRLIDERLAEHDEI